MKSCSNVFVLFLESIFRRSKQKHIEQSCSILSFAARLRLRIRRISNSLAVSIIELLDLIIELDTLVKYESRQSVCGTINGSSAKNENKIRYTTPFVHKQITFVPQIQNFTEFSFRCLPTLLKISGADIISVWSYAW